MGLFSKKIHHHGAGQVEQQKIVNLLMAWIEREYNDYNSNKE